MGKLGKGEGGVADEAEGVERRGWRGRGWREGRQGQADVLLGGATEVRMEMIL